MTDDVEFLLKVIQKMNNDEDLGSDIWRVDEMTHDYDMDEIFYTTQN